MIFNDIDRWRAALKKCNLRESIMPTSRGYLVENVDTYNKVQAMLDCQEMDAAYGYLYELDMEDLTEEDIQKVDKLYETAVERGVIQPLDEDDDEEGDKEETDECDDLDTTVTDIVATNKVAAPKKPHVAPHPHPAPIPTPEPAAPRGQMGCFTVLYSAMKNGEIRTGESYSNCCSPKEAKIEIIHKLQRAGYENIEILAIEAGDPDAAFNDGSFDQDFGYSDDEEISDFGEEILPGVFEDDDEKDTKEDKDNAEEESSDEKSDENIEDSDDSDEEPEDDEEVENTEDAEDEEAEDSEEKEDSEEDAEDDSDEETDDEDSEDAEEELSKEDKNKYKDQYTKAFKAAMKSCEFDKAFDDLTLAEKVEFFEKIQKDWSDDKPDPVKFMDVKELEALNKEVIKKN